MSDFLKSNPKILLVGGVHGDETTGIDLVQKLEQKPIPNITPLLGNPAAVKKRKRFFETDLNRSFGKIPISREEKLAAQISQQLGNYDLVLDFHNTESVGTNCAIVTCQPSLLHYFLAHYFGFEKIVIMPPSGSLIHQAGQNAISLEISNSDQARFSVDYFYEKLVDFTTKFASIADSNQTQVFEYTTSVNQKTYQRIKGKLGQIADFQAFNLEQKAILNLGKEAGNFCPLFFQESRSKTSDTSFLILRQKS